MKKVTRISEVISYLNLIKQEFGNLKITINMEFYTSDIKDDCNPVIYGDDEVYLNLLKRDKETDPDPDEEEVVISIQNYARDE